jgi:hypothetical protein
MGLTYLLWRSQKQDHTLRQRTEPVSVVVSVPFKTPVRVLER